MSGNKRGSSFDILFEQDQEYSNTKRMKFDSTKKSDLIKAEQIESTNMQPDSGATMLEPMTSSEQILLKEVCLILEGSRLVSSDPPPVFPFLEAPPRPQRPPNGVSLPRGC